MTNERKKLYIYAAINFLVGVIMGIVLFYGQMKNEPDFFSTEFFYDKTFEAEDLFRVWWLNLLWMFSVFIAHSILPLSAVHSIVWVRGCAGAFSAMYILNFIGIKETVASVLPQCISILPLLMWFSVKCVEKRKLLQNEGREPFSLKRTEAVMIFAVSLAGAIAEAAVFGFLCYVLF